MTSQQQVSAFSWFFKPGYFQGVFWICMVCLTSSLNDVLMRQTGSRLPSMEVAFFRFFFSLLTLLPIMLSKGTEAFRTTRGGFHTLRALLGFGAVAFWCTGVAMTPLAVVSTLALTVPIFVLPMAVVFLRETVGWQRTAATLAGFVGIFVIISSTSGTQGLIDSFLEMRNGTLFLIAASILFALSDILNKKMVVKESDLTMLFYFAFGTTICGAVPAYYVWVQPTFTELAYLLALGAGGNLILFFLLKAFAATDVSALAPYRYVELFFATAFGFLLYQEIPSFETLIGAAIIIPSTFAIAYYETHLAKKKGREEPKPEVLLKEAA